MMNKGVLASILGVLLIGFACASGTTSLASPPVVGSVSPPIPTEVVPSALPITPTFAGCAYMWGSQDMPELSRKLNAELQAISADVTALAYAYGENCVYADGHQTFGAMETDFRIGIQVTTIRDQGTMGDWIRKVMQVILALPPEQLQGPQPGRVDFDFKQADLTELLVTVPIDRYRSQADDLRGADLFKLFYTAP